jgi:hypothetical protein
MALSTWKQRTGMPAAHKASCQHACSNDGGLLLDLAVNSSAAANLVQDQAWPAAGMVPVSPATGLRHEGQDGFWLSHVAKQGPQNMCPHERVWHASSHSWQIGHVRWLDRTSAIFPLACGMFSLFPIGVRTCTPCGCHADLSGFGPAPAERVVASWS